MLSRKRYLGAYTSLRSTLLVLIWTLGVASASGQIATSTGVTLSPSPVPQGATPTATVIVTASDGSTPTSSVTCAIQARGHSASYSATLQGGAASISLQAIAQDPVGSYTLACSYPGTSGYAASSASPLSFSIVTATTITVSIAPSSVTYGSYPVATASVTASDGTVPTGSVSCNIQTRGHAASYSSALTNGSASLPLTTIGQDPVGAYSLVCSYGGTSTYAASSSASASLTVTQAASVITWPTPTAITYPTPLSSTQQTATANVPGTFVYSPAPGTVLQAGSYTLSVTFTPTDATDYASATSKVALVVNPGSAATLSVTSSSPSIPYGSSVTFTATISSGITGSIAFHDGSALLGTANISGTTATFATSGLATGTHTITASWQGNASYPPVTSSSISQVVNGVAVSGQPGTLATVAGNGVHGFAGDGGPATAAALTSPGAVLDGANNIYFCDGPSRVREISATTGLINTVAGTGTTGFSGDGGPATSAQINCAAMGVDSAGDIFIADAYTNRIRKVAASGGKIATVAGNGTAGDTGDGGQATSAAIQLASTPSASAGGSTPIDMGVAGNGDLYFFNSKTISNNPMIDVIRVVKASTGVISTLSGGPYDNTGGTQTTFAVDSNGNVYLFHIGSGAIYETSASSGSTTLIAGTATEPGYSGDGGPATQAQLNTVSGVVDSSGNVYFVQNNFVRKVNAKTGIISVVAQLGTGGMGCFQQTDSIGDGCLSLDAEGGAGSLLAVDNNGNLYTANSVYLRSISAPSPTQIQPSSITLSCGNGSIPYGEGVTCNAKVTGGTNGTGPTGTVSLAYPAGVNQTLYGPANTIASGAITETLPVSSLPVGTYSVAATYNGDSTYIPALATATLAVTQATPSVTWPPPNPIVYGTALSAQQLNASSAVPGTFTYTPGYGALLPVGTNTIKVSFQPNDTKDYAGPVTTSQTLTVSKVTPAVVWATPAPIQFGTTLSSAQLNASANVPGTFAYYSSGNPVSASSATVLPVGVDTLTVVFTPTSSTNDTSTSNVTASVQIQVLPDAPSIAGIMPNPTAVGTTVTISGQNFGPSKGSVTFNGVAATVTTWSNTSIVTTVPTGATTGNVVVNASGVGSNNFLLMISKTCP